MIGFDSIPAGVCVSCHTKKNQYTPFSECLGLRENNKSISRKLEIKNKIV